MISRWGKVWLGESDMCFAFSAGELSEASATSWFETLSAGVGSGFRVSAYEFLEIQGSPSGSSTYQSPFAAFRCMHWANGPGL